MYFCINYIKFPGFMSAVIYALLLQQSTYVVESLRRPNTRVQPRLFIIARSLNRSHTFIRIHYSPRYVYLYLVTLKTCLYTSPVGMVRLQNERTGAKSMSLPRIWPHKDGVYTRASISRVLGRTLDSTQLITFALW